MRLFRDEFVRAILGEMFIDINAIKAQCSIDSEVNGDKQPIRWIILFTKVIFNRKKSGNS